MIRLHYHSDIRSFSEEPHLSKSDKRVLTEYNRLSNRLQADQYKDQSNNKLAKIIDTPRSVSRKLITGILAVGNPGMALEFNKSSLMRRGALPDKISNSKLGTWTANKLANRQKLKDQRKLDRLSQHHIIKSQQSHVEEPTS